ncbi:MAG TPA: ABC transporter ATP-binding protein [Candidatus Kapabacteria bacterium]|nr:ABC transporter ATP-binding protein [Candidatus Kapabacteria bacterium]
MMTSERTLELRVDALAKRFGPREVFANLNLRLMRGDSLAVTGRNGSGKSTFLKVIANTMEATAGRVTWRDGDADLDAAALTRSIGYVAPYLQLYTEFTLLEHARLMQQMRGLPFDQANADALFQRFGIAGRRNDRLSTFSSGMLQRAKFICALIHNPPFLLLDEPMSTLDLDGIAAMRELVSDRRTSRITVIATNEEEDLDLCTKRLAIG